MTTTETIADLATHPDAEALARFDHPTGHLSAWRGTLIAKAWIGSDLACFFVEAEDALSHYVLVFPELGGFRPVVEGQDMTGAGIGSVFELDVLIKFNRRIIVQRADTVA
ncbi:hypothetical protein [Hyphomicrobium sp.]|uniref:hypothetical protein n=1 Tax=Hyphomicrobium sp. TaxID=82 RepID=UPI0025C403FC|nr:hypothetical protein [Hyphomicrobium sp.]MCC7252379.1 hypothetical protein [Hyphomicrobium sp.]